MIARAMLSHQTTPLQNCNQMLTNCNILSKVIFEPQIWSVAIEMCVAISPVVIFNVVITHVDGIALEAGATRSRGYSRGTAATDRRGIERETGIARLALQGVGL